jgi:hypothetical protein
MLNADHKYSTTDKQDEKKKKKEKKKENYQSTPDLEEGRQERRRTFLHCSPHWSLIGPSMPHARLRNHQKLPTIAPATTKKTINFVRSARRRAVKTKWSSMCAAMRTPK